ncbi:hypothetical protein NP493_194g08007 [Ridgeia piscesae]|uniref:Uncharacterized protein n=1 Tax=Ridgeia piscesae TaxID=27915 RepID=A0AAD9UET2_RIDPI|nr:hypothetical protein NP493_194g08007 [Ridgeia piscesae]
MSLVTQYNTAMEELMEQAKVAETRLRGRQEEHQALQKQLDDVMYTMAQQGYTKMIDANGNSIDLTTKNGTPLQLKGGVGSASKEDTERYLATIASQEDAITSLHEECNSLRPQIGVAGKKVAQLEHMLQVGGSL